MPAKKTASQKRTREVPTENKRLIPTDVKRAHKEISRYSDLGESSKVAKPIVIKKGKGKKLSDIEIIEKHITKRTRSDPLLRSLHGLLIGRVNKAINAKENLGNFSGVVYDEEMNRSKLEAKLEKHHLSELRDFLAFFGLLKKEKLTKEDAVKELCDYLEKPHANVEESAASPKKRKRSSSPAQSKSPSKKSSSKSPKKKRAKKDPNAPKKAMTAYILFSMDRRAEVIKKHGKEPIGETAKRIGLLWKKATADDKKKFQDKADKDKKRYEKEKKEYEKNNPKEKKEKKEKETKE